MKLVGAIGATVLSLSLGVGVAAYAQQEQHEQREENKDKPAQEKERKAQPQKPAKHAEQRAQEHRSQEVKPGKQEEHARGNGVGRIPDDRFRANFGRDHRFRVSEADYRRDRRFQYGGYWFGFVQPWPSNWLYTQDVYVVEIEGVYYLCNANYPGVNLTLSFTM
jgi:hypothetical protein